MNLLTNIFKAKNLLNFASLLLIISVFVNFTHDHFESYEIVENNTYKKYSNPEFKKNINEQLSSDETYSTILNRECQVSGDMHDRHKVRWVKAFFLKTLFKESYNINQSLPYYINIFLHSFFIFLSLFFLNKTFNLEKKFTLFFLLYTTFVFQNYLGEYSASIFEMFFMSIGLYASKNKKIYLLTLVTLLAFLNRESGLLILFTWLIFNSDYKKLIIPFILVTASFLVLNFNIIKCIINPKFFIPLERQGGQVNFSDISSISFLSLSKLIVINFIFPFGIALYGYLQSKIRNNFFLILLSIYLLIFLFAIPLHHMAARLLILPLIFVSFYFLKTSKNSNYNL